MPLAQLFIKRVYEIITEMKLPFIDERIYKSVKINDANVITNVVFEYSDDESTIRGFLGMVNYFQSVVIKKGDDFYILGGKLLFHLRCAR